MKFPNPSYRKTKSGPVEYADVGKGKPLLALHGAMGGYDQSYILARTVGPDDARVIAVSRPGYLGTPLKSGETPEQQAYLCALLLDQLGIKETAVVAVSGGGPCALNFALRHPDKCKALILVSTCGGVMNTPIPFSFKLMQLFTRWQWIADWMKKRTARDIVNAAKRAVKDDELCERTLAHPQAGPLFKTLLLSTFDQMSKRLTGTKNDIIVTRKTDYPLEKIEVPTLVVHGTADSVVPYEKHAGSLSQRIPRVKLLTIENGEHVAIFTHRDLVQSTVCDFLNTL